MKSFRKVKKISNLGNAFFKLEFFFDLTFLQKVWEQTKPGSQPKGSFKTTPLKPKDSFAPAVFHQSFFD